MTALSFCLYLVLVAAIAVAAWRRTGSVADYVLGGRRITAPVAALSAGASDMSAWLLLGLPGLAVIAPASALWTASGLLLGTWCNWRFVAARLRETSAAFGALTLPDYFAQRFPARATLLRTLCGLSIVVFFLLYTSAGLVAAGKLFSTVFDLSYSVGVLLGAALVLGYTIVGGFLAVTWTDVLQALLMAAMLALVAFILVAERGSEPLLRLTAEHPSAVTVLSALAWGLGYMGQPHILQRFMALRHPADAVAARRIAVGWTAFGLVCAILIGSAGHHLVAAGGDPERVFMLGAEMRLAPWLAGICLAAILAAIMSTADSQLLVTGVTLAEDLLPLIRRGARTNPLRQGRIAVALVCCGAAALALRPDTGVLDLVARAWSGFGATIGPALIVALHARHASADGAVAGMLGGALVVVCWPLLPQGGFGVYELLPAFVTAIVVNLVVSSRSADLASTATS